MKIKVKNARSNSLAQADREILLSPFFSGVPIFSSSFQQGLIFNRNLNGRLKIFLPMVKILTFWLKIAKNEGFFLINPFPFSHNFPKFKLTKSTTNQESRDSLKGMINRLCSH